MTIHDDLAASMALHTPVPCRFHDDCRELCRACLQTWPCNAAQIVNALQAVVEVHRPFRPTHPKNVAYSDMCSACRGEHGAFSSWPCDTIRAIEEVMEAGA